MGTSRGRALLYLLLVIGGGVVLIANTVFDLTVSTDEYVFELGFAGFMLLVGGVVGFVEATDRRRTRAIGWVGLVAGLVLIIVVDALVALGPFVYYAGIAVLVVTGTVLFFTIFESGREDRANAS